MLTIHGERLKDYYKLQGKFESDKEIENACNKIIEEKNKSRDITIMAFSNIPNKKYYLLTFLENETKR